MNRSILSMLLVSMMLLSGLSVLINIGPENSEASFVWQDDLVFQLQKGAAAYDGSRYIYYFGGSDQISQYHGEVQRIDTTDGSSETVSDFPELTSSVAAWSNGYAFVFGGMYSNGTFSDEIYRFDPTDWRDRNH